jgi:hypothetical protein
MRVLFDGLVNERGAFSVHTGGYLYKIGGGVGVCWRTSGRTDESQTTRICCLFSLLRVHIGCLSSPFSSPFM